MNIKDCIMNIIPAIDLQSGQCVRLSKGQFDRVSVYSDDPVGTAVKFEKAGAKFLHIVDLDGAKNSRFSQTNVISAIRQATNLTIQVGGGINNKEIVQNLINAGVDRVVIGSLAVKDIIATKAIINEFGHNHVVLAFDVNIDLDGVPIVATGGWQHKSEYALDAMMQKYSDVGLKHVLCTDISRDGMLSGPNVALYKSYIDQFRQIEFQASGGVSSLEDLQILKKNDVNAVIIGKAIYENKFSLEQALSI